MMRQFLCACLLALSCGGVFAAEVAGVKFDDKVSMGGQELVLNGAGLRSKLFFQVYAIGLYLPQRQTTTVGVLAQKSRRLHLVFLRPLSSEQLIDAMNSRMAENNTPAELGAIKKEMEQLTNIFNTLKEGRAGTVILIDYTADAGTKIVVNGVERGTMPGEAFNRALMKAWLGDKPAQPDLKSALLGG
jgi:hypothetical protein